MRTCFVIMGFGIKTDFQTGRKLDLDKTYNNIIKPAVEAAGLKCERADEIVHSGMIDVPMYDRLLNADVVVADVSTMNANAFYELGVRHALKPCTTIILAEDQLKFPFDLGHIAIRTYKHLGEDIGFSEAMAKQKELKEAIVTLLGCQPLMVDSPVYTCLQLTPPRASLGAGAGGGGGTSFDVLGVVTEGPSMSELMKQATTARDSGNWAEAWKGFGIVRDQMRAGSADPYVTQQLAWAICHADMSEPGLDLAAKVLAELEPERSNDPETLWMWGYIHQCKWDEAHEPRALDTAIAALEKAFTLGGRPLAGVHAMVLLNDRAKLATGDDAVADRVLAARLRARLVELLGGGSDAEAKLANLEAAARTH